ncbi:MAG: cytochrome c nitrite reductase small subunit [Deltaproteobacteria bacterium]|nr:MAG: cytochrome c nitrite reductase small subunit [Deltaproteobacteria bacterium]
MTFSTLSCSGYLIWITLTSIPTGFVAGTFIYSKGYSYMLDDPRACANCHVMNDHLKSYERSSHHHVANCNSCHTPEGFIPKYFSKAVNGWNHGLAFTTGNHPWPLKLTDYNKKITQQSCMKCHQGILQTNHNDKVNCIHCHSSVGHIR